MKLRKCGLLTLSFNLVWHTRQRMWLLIHIWKVILIDPWLWITPAACRIVILVVVWIVGGLGKVGIILFYWTAVWKSVFEALIVVMIVNSVSLFLGGSLDLAMGLMTSFRTQKWNLRNSRNLPLVFGFSDVLDLFSVAYLDVCYDSLTLLALSVLIAYI